jgi:hypothetical protein
MNRMLAYYLALLSLWAIASFATWAKSPTLQSLPYDSKSSYMIDFTKTNEIARWRSTNDGVMGGLSQGGLSFVDQTSVFSGTISLENNGGFSSIYRPIVPLARGLDTVSLDIVGDGLTYQMRVAVAINGYRVSYKHDFDTVAGERQKIVLSLNDFQAVFRGRIIEGAPRLKSEDLRQVGFLVTTKEQGPFALFLYSLKIQPSYKEV